MDSFINQHDLFRSISSPVQQICRISLRIIRLDTDTDVDTDIDTDIDTDTDVDPDPDSPKPTPTPTPKPQPTTNTPDGSITYTQRKAVDNLIDTTDKRQYMRFNVNEITTPVYMEKQDGINSLIDISRGGIALEHNNSLKAGDIIPVHLKYKDTDVQAEVRIVDTNGTRAGAEFINLDETLANQLLYMNIMLEADNDLLVTRIKV